MALTPFNGTLDAPSPSGLKPFDGQLDGEEPQGGLIASLKRTTGQTIAGIGQAAGDYLPGVSQDNALKRYGQEVIEANPTAVNSLGDIADKPWTALKEATGNAAASIGSMVGAKALGQGVSAVAPFTGPARPIVAALGKGIEFAGPTIAAALPSYGGIRQAQQQNAPEGEADSLQSKALAAGGAGLVGLIEGRFGPENWALKAMGKEGREQLAKQFAADSLTGGLAKGALKGAATEGAEEIVQNPIEQLSSYQDPTTAANVQDTLFGGAMGALGGGVFGGGAGGLGYYANRNQPQADPNAGPLSRAAATAEASGASAAVAPMQATPQEAPAELPNDILRAVRSSQGQEAVDSLLYANALARNPQASPQVRQRAQAEVDQAIQVVQMQRDQANARMLAPSPDVPPAGSFGNMNEFADLLTQERADLDRLRNPAPFEEMTGVAAGYDPANRLRNQVPEPQGTFGQMNEFADLLNAEQADVAQQRDALAQRQDVQRESRLESIQGAIEGGRQREATDARRSLLDTILNDPETKNPLPRFESMLKKQGYAQRRATDEERQAIERFQSARDTFADMDREQAAPNELDAAAMGIRERQPKVRQEPPKQRAAFPMSREGAERQAAQRSQETGQRFEAVPHPTVAGRFAVQPVQVGTSTNDVLIQGEISSAQTPLDRAGQGDVGATLDRQGAPLVGQGEAAPDTALQVGDGAARQNTAQPLDHGLLNLPLSKRMGNIDAQLDRYKREQASQARTAAKTETAQRKIDKARAKELFAQHGDAMVARYGSSERLQALGGAKVVRNELDQMVKWQPQKFVQLAEKFTAEQEQPPNGTTPAQALPQQAQRQAQPAAATAEGVADAAEPATSAEEAGQARRAQAEAQGGAQESGQGVGRTLEVRPSKLGAVAAHRAMRKAYPDANLEVVKQGDGWAVVDRTDDPFTDSPVNAAEGALARLAQLQGMAQAAGWSEKGGKLLRDKGDEGEVTGRTAWVPTEAWFAGKPAGVTEHHMRSAVEKTAAGRGILTKPERDGLKYMTDTLRDLEQQAQQGQNERNVREAELSAIADQVAAELDAAEVEAIREQLAIQMEDATQEDYLLALKEAFHEKAVQSRANRETQQADAAGARAGVQDGRGEGSREASAFQLESQTEQDLAARDAAQQAAEQQRQADEQARERKAQADSERGSFALTGSDRPADVMAAQGQGGLFEPDSTYTANESGAKARKNDDYTQDLFGQPVPDPERVPDRVEAQSDLASSAEIFAAGQADGAIYATEAGPRTVGTVRSTFDRVESAAQAAHVLAGLRKSPQERFQVLVLDADSRPIAVLNLFAGATAQTSVYPEVVTKAVYETPGAAKIWYAHNHPSGTASPSTADEMLTRELSKAFGDGTGIDVAGHVIIAGSRSVEMDADGDHLGGSFAIPAGVRRHEIRITERRFTKVGTLAEAITSPGVARQTVRRLANERAGVVLLNAQNAPVAFLPLSAAQMQQLRDGQSARLLFGAVARSNASAAILHFPAAENAESVQAATRNMYEALDVRGIRVLDALVGAASLAERGDVRGNGTNGIFRSFAGESARNADTGTTPDAILAAIRDIIGPFRTNRITVVQSADELVSQGVLSSRDAQGTQAFVKDGRAYFIAGNIRPGNERAVFLHEVGAHLGMEKLLSPFARKVLLTKIRNWSQQSGTLESRIAQAALRRVEAAGTSAEQADSELLAYFVEEAVKAGVNPTADAQSAIGQWFRQFMAGVRAALEALGLMSPKQLTAQDVVDLAHGAANVAMESDATAGGAQFSRDQTRTEDDARIQFSKAATLDAPSLAGRAGDFLADVMKTPGTFGVLAKTLQTQYHKATKNPLFKSVWTRAHGMYIDSARAMSRPAALAPDLLPKLEATDVAEAAKALFGKARNDPRDVKIVADVLSSATLAGDGGPLSGVRYTAQTLRDGVKAGDRIVKLTEQQIKLYEQGRAAIDASLDESAAAEAWKLVRRHANSPELRNWIAQNPQDAATVLPDTLAQSIEDTRERLENLNGTLETLRDGLADEAEIKAREKDIRRLEKQLDDLNDTAERVDAIFEKAKALKEAGYMPLMRFGQFRIAVTNTEDGSIEYVSRYESAFEANRVRRKLLQDFPESDGFTVGVVETTDPEAWKMYKGVNPETIMLFAKESGVEVDEVMQTWYKEATASRSSLRRLVHRHGYQGFSDDLPRVLASFITSNGKQAGYAYHLADMLQMMQDKAMPGDVHEEARKLLETITEPTEKGAGFRGLMATWYLLGSVASATVNATQTLTMSLPFLSQFGKKGFAPGEAMGHLSRAYSQIFGKITDAKLVEAIKRAEEDGIVDSNEVFHLYAESMKPMISKLGSGGIGYRARAAMTLWGAPFAMVEKLNRKATFIAAYQMAKSQGKSDAQAFEFGERAVVETQGIYAKHNRPNWARGAIGGSVLVFRQYSIAYLEMLSRMWQSGPEGKKAAGLALGILFLTAGAAGMPGEDDLLDLIDTFSQVFLGKATVSRMELRNWLEDTVGKEVGGFINSGVSEFLPFDVSGRMGMGNLLPGTALLKPSEPDKFREAFEAFGVPGSFAMSAVNGAQMVLGGNVTGALKTFAPKAVQDVVKGMEIAGTGEVRDALGRKVIDADITDTFFQTIGFNPAAKAEAGRKAFEVNELIGYHKRTESNIVAQMARGIADRDQEVIDDAREKLMDWNRNNPDAPILINSRQIQQRIRQLQMERSGRVVKLAPPELRRRVTEALEE